jgi:hypothetical protein
MGATRTLAANDADGKRGVAVRSRLAMTDAPPFAGKLLELRHNPWIMALAATPFLGTLACIAGGLLGNPALFALTIHTSILGLGAMLYAFRRNFRPIVKDVEVRADETGVHVGDRFVPRSELRAGLIVPRMAPGVLLRRRFRLPVELQATSTGEARALLRALGLDVSQTVATFRTLSRLMSKRRYGFTLGVLFGASFLTLGRTVGPHPSSLALALMVLIGFVGAFLALAPTRLDVGADGIALQWLGQTRFIGYEDITVVTRFERSWGRSRMMGIKLLLRSNDEVLIPVTTNEWGNLESLRIIEERINEGMASFREGGALADAALLKRGERALSDWVVALRSLGAGANADLRTAPVPRDRLFRIVEDPAAAPADRAAAAVALGGELDDQGRTRLKAVAAATAAPRLRIAIEKAAEPDLAAVEEALAALEGEEEKARARA